MATIWAIGRNYKDHAAEMKVETPDSPLVFIKSDQCITTGKTIEIPEFTKDLHHEIELAVKLGPLLIASEVALALDLTARDIQTELKKKGHPWALAKSFLGSCPISSWIPYENDEWFSKLSFSLDINGQCQQHSNTSKMIFPLPTLILHLQKYFPVRPGDIVLTGTPSGVGPLNHGDHLMARIPDQLEMEWVVS